MGINGFTENCVAHSYVQSAKVPIGTRLKRNEYRLAEKSVLRRMAHAENDSLENLLGAASSVHGQTSILRDV